MAATGQIEGLAAILQRLHALEDAVVSLEATVVEQAETIAKLEGIIASQAETIAKQRALILKYQSMLFDKKSEKVSGKDSKKAAAKETDPASGEDSPPQNTNKRRGQRSGAPGHGRRLYEELPPREELYELPEGLRHCDNCGTDYVECGTEDSVTVEWEVSIRRVVKRRMKYRRACNCHRSIIITAPAPAKLFRKALLEISTVAKLLVNKFLHGQPINRQLNEIEMHCGVRFAPGTIVGVHDKVTELLRPLYDEFILHLREADRWHADETRWMQFADECKKRWWLWVFSSSDVVSFVLDPTRSRNVPRRIFGLDDPDAHRAFGFLSCDRWKSYQGIDGLLAAFCWAHVRRDFIDLAKKYPRIIDDWVKSWIERIGMLYHLNKQRLSYDPGTEDFRQADATLRDHVAEIVRVREAEAKDVSLILPARKVLESMSRHWEGLTIFVDHPEIPMDNNEAERLLRTSVVGRKNFYGSGSFKSGVLTESAYTILLTADKNGLNPLTYLRAYLDACAQNGGESPQNIARFLPWKASPEDLAAWKLPTNAS